MKTLVIASIAAALLVGCSTTPRLGPLQTGEVRISAEVRAAQPITMAFDGASQPYTKLTYRVILPPELQNYALTLFLAPDDKRLRTHTRGNVVDMNISERKLRAPAGTPTVR